MNQGLIPLSKDSRDRKHRFTRRYGATALADIPSSFDTDAGLTDPDQNADGRPTECTAYAKTDMATDMTGKVFDPDYTYAMTLRIAGLPPETQGADLRMAFKSVIQYGLLLKSDAPDFSNKTQQEVADYRVWLSYVDRAVKNAQPAYKWIYDDIYDHFDDIRSAIITFYRISKIKQPIDWGIPWYPQFMLNDTCTLDTIKDATPSSWHDVTIKGWVTINGEPYLKLKYWQKGRVKYFSRDLVNYLYTVEGTGAGMYDPTGNRTWSIFGIIIEQFPQLLKVPGLLSIFWKASNV